jgi:hypothetical protein
MDWDPTNRALRPVNATWAKRAEQRWSAGEIYHVTDEEPRSQASHNHYFASVEEAWKNLSEDLVERFPTAKHLRTHALIRTGWCNRREVLCGTRAAALELAKVIKDLDTYAVVDIPQDGTVAAVLTARSQSTRAMNKDDFQKSKDDVLGFIANLIGVKPEDLRANTGRAA